MLIRIKKKKQQNIKIFGCIMKIQSQDMWFSKKTWAKIGNKIHFWFNILVILSPFQITSIHITIIKYLKCVRKQWPQYFYKVWVPGEAIPLKADKSKFLGIPRYGQSILKIYNTIANTALKCLLESVHLLAVMIFKNITQKRLSPVDYYASHQIPGT